jgi:hypothetical protein
MKQLNGYIEGLEQLAMENRKPFAVVRCTNASIASGDCNSIEYIIHKYYVHAETFATPFHF